MNFGDCKSRFFSIQAATSMADSKVFQVCGELTLKGQPAPRRFCQTIVLAQPHMAPPNVLYVKSNIFQVLMDFKEFYNQYFPVDGHWLSRE